MNLPTTHVSGGSGEIDAATVFNVANQSDFGNFAKDMLAVERYEYTNQSIMFQYLCSCLIFMMAALHGNLKEVPPLLHSHAQLT
jgi:hypothetical protein